MTNSNSENMRKLLNVISEDGPLAPGAFVDPLAAPAVDPVVAPDMTPDPSMDDPMDDAPTSGPETKVEVTMKDGDEVEVEVYAQQGDELSRLMQLAGQFHKDKQGGTLAEPPVDAAPVDMTPDMGMEPDMGMDMPVEPDMGMDIPPEGGPDVPTGSEMDDMELGMDDAPEVDFAMGDEEPMPMEENVTKKHDFGYPNPMQGQEEYELKAYGFQGGASKPVRFVPARSGDNPMVDTSDRKGLREYVSEIESGKKKFLSELANDEDADSTVSNLASGVKVDDSTLDKLKKVAKDTQQGTSPDEKDSEKMDDVLDAADAQGVQLNPNQKKELEKNVKDQQKDDSISEDSIDVPDFKMNIVDEEELAERKRRYSFSKADFGRGIITSPDAKRKRSAKRGLSIYKK